MPLYDRGLSRLLAKPDSTPRPALRLAVGQDVVPARRGLTVPPTLLQCFLGVRYRRPSSLFVGGRQHATPWGLYAAYTEFLSNSKWLWPHVYAKYTERSVFLANKSIKSTFSRFCDTYTPRIRKLYVISIGYEVTYTPRVRRRF
jgi:hypothetical protein